MDTTSVLYLVIMMYQLTLTITLSITLFQVGITIVQDLPTRQPALTCIASFLLWAEAFLILDFAVKPLFATPLPTSSETGVAELSKGTIMITSFLAGSIFTVIVFVQVKIVQNSIIEPIAARLNWTDWKLLKFSVPITEESRCIDQSNSNDF